MGWTAQGGGVAVTDGYKPGLGDLSRCLLGSVHGTHPEGKQDSAERNAAMLWQQGLLQIPSGALELAGAAELNCTGTRAPSPWTPVQINYSFYVCHPWKEA